MRHLLPRLNTPLWQSLALALAYFISARLCVYVADTGKAPAAIWVPSGIALAGLIHFGPRAWPGVFLGSLAANFVVELSPPAALALALGNALDPLVAVLCIRHYAGRNLDFGRTRHVLAYIAFGVLLGPAISGAFGTFGLQIGGVFSSLKDDLIGWVGWSLEDALSVLIVTSALLIASQARSWEWASSRKKIEAVALFAILGVSGWLVLTGTRGDPLSEPYLVLPLMLWIVLRLGSGGAIMGNLLLTVISAVGIVDHTGPFLLDTMTDSMVWMQAFWAIASLTTLLLAAALNEARSERYREMFNGNQTIQLVLDAISGRIVDANPAACAFYGQPSSGMRQLSMRDLTASQESRASYAMRGSFLACHRISDGALRQVEVYCNPIQLGGRSLVYAIVHDMTPRRQAEEALRQSEERLQLVARATNDTVWDWDIRSNHVWHNQGHASVFGHRVQDADREVEWWLDHIHPSDRDSVMAAISTAIAQRDETWAREYRFLRGDGEYAHVLARGSLLYENGSAIRMVGVMLDLSERKRMEEELAHRATHDTLTGLANRYAIERTLSRAVRQSRDDGASMGLLLADLNRFKEINDTFGHQVGDGVLQVVADRWRSALRQNDTLGRLAGDEFAVILPSADAAIAEAIAERLVRALDEPIVLDGQTLRVGASVGLATCPGDATDMEALLRKADNAMYAVKRRRDVEAA